MDHWGDPWADDVETNTPLNEELDVKKPPGAPPVIHGFADEAQWGNPADGDEFGGWAELTAPAAYQGPQSKDVARLKDLETTSTFTPSEQHVDDKPLSAWQWTSLRPKNDQSDGPLVIHEETGQYGLIEESQSLDSGPWGNIYDRKPPENDLAGVEIETSDSGTIVQPETTNDERKGAESGILEDDASTRASTSPSEASPHEISHESPRTSFDEEGTLVEISGGLRDIGKQEIEALADIEENVADLTQDAALERKAEAEVEDDDEFGDFEEENEDEDDEVVMNVTPIIVAPITSSIPESHKRTEDPKESMEVSRGSMDSENGSEARKPIPTASFHPELALIDQLFTAPPSIKPLDNLPDETISTTSTRRAWYRLTREQTMREFNSGNDDDSYVRVSWIGSTVRTEVNKIVSRWTAEDRIAGHAVLGGKSSGAMFFWDQPTHSAEPTIRTTPRHARERSSISSTVGTVPPYLSSNSMATPQSPKSPVAHFNWSSSPQSPPFPAPPRTGQTAEASQARIDELARNSAGKMNSAKVYRSAGAFDIALSENGNASVTRLQYSTARPSSMDITRGLPSHPTHKRASQSTTITSSSFNTSAPSQKQSSVGRLDNPPSFSTPGLEQLDDMHESITKTPRPMDDPVVRPMSTAASTSVMDTDPWAGLTRLDTGSKAPSAPQNPPQDGDDDWGEMVQSPVTPGPTPILPQAQNKPEPSQDPSHRYAPSIVRLMTPISPTTSSGPTPANPFGSIMQPTVVSRTPPLTVSNAKTSITPPSLPSTREQGFQRQSFLENHESSFFDSAPPSKPAPFCSTAIEKPVQSVFIPTSTPVQPESLASADFSLFDYNTPPTASNSSSASGTKHARMSSFPVSAPGASDPLATADFSIFETPGTHVAQPIQAAPIPTTRHVPVSPAVPHSHVPSTKQKEAEEADVLRKIIAGLPDLSYMLL